MPAWANNPDYTLHATTTKPEDKSHKPVFDIFSQDDSDKPEERKKSDQDSPATRF